MFLKVFLLLFAPLKKTQQHKSVNSFRSIGFGGVWTCECAFSRAHHNSLDSSEFTNCCPSNVCSKAKVTLDLLLLLPLCSLLSQSALHSPKSSCSTGEINCLWNGYSVCLDVPGSWWSSSWLLLLFPFNQLTGNTFHLDYSPPPQSATHIDCCHYQDCLWSMFIKWLFPNGSVQWNNNNTLILNTFELCLAIHVDYSLWTIE